MNTATQLFIRSHADDDVRKLAFIADKNPDVDMPFALNQIAGQQMARHKLPSWAEKEDVIYPPHLSMEQCSSEQTARYKAEVVQRFLMQTPHEGYVKPKEKTTVFADLTGGFGVDFSFIAPLFDKAVYVERQQQLCENAQHNFRQFDLSHAEVVCADAEDYIKSMKWADFIFLDPARRNEKGSKVVRISDCTPDVSSLLGVLLTKARYVLVKLSPMLDWHSAVEKLNKQGALVHEVHIVSVHNECKELLILLSGHAQQADSAIAFPDTKIICANDNASFSYSLNAENESLQSIFKDEISVGMFLYEPNSALMKAGCFALLTKRFGVEAVATNSHLFVSREKKPHFPGCIFQIIAISSLNKRKTKAALQDIKQANIAVRNFPLSVAELRKRLRIKEGGSTYIFATTNANNQHLLLVCQKEV